MPWPPRSPRSAPRPTNFHCPRPGSGSWRIRPGSERVVHLSKEEPMALVPLAAKGNYFHVYDFRVKPGRGDEFIELFNKFDYGDNNPFHQSRAQVKDGVLCRDAADPDHFYLIGEWRDIEEHRRIRERVAREIRPEFVSLIEGGGFVPNYAEIVSMTPQEVLDQAQAG